MRILRAAITVAGAGIFAAFIYSQVSAPLRLSPEKSQAKATTTAPHAAAFLQQYCYECHSGAGPDAAIGFDTLAQDQNSIGTQSVIWERVARMLESKKMPPPEASAFPTDAERDGAIHWVRTSLAAYEEEHAGDPGRVTIRRLTSAEYAYAIEDLTGVKIPVPIEASSDSVGGEGFSNFGDVQFVQEANTERYLEAAKHVADHALIGTGPLSFYSDPGRTGLELSAYARITKLYDANGFRVVSGEGGHPFGLDRYARAFYVAWYYQNRVALGDPAATLRSLAAKEGITGRFAEHIWSVVNMPAAGYPVSEMIERFKAIPAPAQGAQNAIAKGRADAKALQEYLTAWPSWFFARGEEASDGKGDESPMVFTDASLAVVASREYAYPIGIRAARGRAAPTAGASKMFITFARLNPKAGVKPVVIFRNPRVVTYAAATTGRGRGVVQAADDGDADVAQGVGGAGAAGRRGRGQTRTPLSTQAFKDALPPDVAASLHFGVSPDGSTLGPNDFAITKTMSFDTYLQSGVSMEFQAEAELGADRNAVVRLMLSDHDQGPSRDASEKVILAEPGSAAHKAFRAGMAEYVALLPPNSQGEANPADKDPVPPPFDSTYNTPEHDAFVLKVKYQRADQFLMDNILEDADRTRLNIAWDDLMGAFPYHDGYLQVLADHYDVKLASPKIADMTPEKFEALPLEMRGYLKPVIDNYQQVVRAFKAAEPGQVDDALEFASRAWRRPLTDAEKVNLRSFYEKCRTTMQLDHEGALRALLARVLVSPEFLYRVETVASGPEKTLTDWEMASRLSFFLWASIPDEELRRAAAAGELDQPDLLAKQAKRMIADPKARRIATEFFGQWLGFYHFDEYRGVDTTRFPEFTDAVRTAMYDEAVSTFEYLVRQDRPVKEVLDADYTFLNQPLAQFYGIDKKVDVKSVGAVVKVDGAKALERGGALRLGSVLTVTSAPLRTSPVKRGDWVLRRILGTPTPNPPADAGSLPGDPAAFGGLSLRERLAQHKRNASCASCHLLIDPLGFPLEGFDPLGRTRTAYADGKAVDVTGEFADGKTIKGTDELIGYLNGKDAIFMRNFSRKMLGYALGRTVGASDQHLIDEMVAAGNGSSFADLAVKIVASRQFRNHEGRDTPVPAPAPSAQLPAPAPALAFRPSSQTGASR